MGPSAERKRPALCSKIIETIKAQAAERREGLGVGVLVRVRQQLQSVRGPLRELSTADAKEGLAGTAASTATTGTLQDPVRGALGRAMRGMGRKE